MCASTLSEAINALLFVPKENTEKLGFARLEPAVALYCRKVMIDAKPKDILPEWLRFLKGVVDSEDLPLNISRETMQDRSLLEKLNKVITKRFLKFLDEQAGKDPDSYDKFYQEYQRFLKEGVVTDFTTRATLINNIIALGPSVDLFGNVWTANRDEVGEIDGTPYGSTGTCLVCSITPTGRSPPWTQTVPVVPGERLPDSLASDRSKVRGKSLRRSPLQ